MGAVKRVFLTGATSFTGCHISHAFHEAGFEIVATLTGALADPRDERVKSRLQYAKATRWVEHAPFGSPAFLEALKECRDFVFVNHGASIKGYRSPDFDWQTSVATSLLNGEEVFKVLHEQGCRRVLHSGSIFEPYDGLSEESVYGLSKAKTWERVKGFCETFGLPLSKIVIPNPIGRFENADRLFPVFMRMWKKGDRPTLSTPHLVRDNMPAEWLAGVYVEEAQQLASGVRERRPSAYALSFRDFVDVFLSEYAKRNASAWGYQIQEKVVDVPLRRINNERLPQMNDPQAVRAFWDAYLADLETMA